ncbi:hypothetical protein E2562_002751 [Oryza meyeriana var. granulata]|uniref:Uncharacterized protein n=1 Tax=Oryza meyeriana var. granulata TaxID=110450 RepID=A0A6G1BR81_9ORYZ|nr:hypothetical protein E2562_002751 [Oryza meyeriana var. granulata]
MELPQRRGGAPTRVRVLGRHQGRRPAITLHVVTTPDCPTTTDCSRSSSRETCHGPNTCREPLLLGAPPLRHPAHLPVASRSLHRRGSGATVPP